MIFKECKYLFLSDLYRLTGDVKFTSFLWNITLGDTFKFNFWMRICTYFRSGGYLKKICYWPARLILNRYMFRFGIFISPATEIGSGFFIIHCGGIIVSEHAKIGKNCNISHEVTLGKGNRGKNEGFPTLGDNVYIGPGAKIVGAVTIGNNVAIGANCVVTKDVPDYAVVVGVPGRVISDKGSEGYINRTDYQDKIR